MKISSLFQKIKNYQIKNKIEKCIKYNNLRKALNLSIKKGFIDKEIEIYEKYIEKRDWLPYSAFERTKNFGLIKKAMEFNKRFLKELVSNDSDKISNEVFFKPEFKNNYFKELYYAKENGNYAQINEMVIDKNLMKINPSFTYLYERHLRN